MQELLPGLFEIVLYERPNSRNVASLYLVKGAPGQRNLLVDSGYGTPYCLEKLLTELAAADVPVDSLDVFLTHKHADHCGLAHELSIRGAHMFMNRTEDRHMYDCLYYRLDHSTENAQLRVLKRTGITEERTPLIYHKFRTFNDHLHDDSPIWMMTIEAFDYEDIADGQTFDYGDYHFVARHLYGHTFGQMGLMDTDKKLYLIADQVLNHTVPIVGTSHTDEFLLNLYFDSIADLAEHYADWTLLPAHEGQLTDVAASAAHIRAAYQRKIELCLECLTDKKQTVWEINRQVYGLTPGDRSDKQFYLSKMTNTKTFSLLEYLYRTGQAHRTEEDGMLFWTK